MADVSKSDLRKIIAARKRGDTWATIQDAMGIGLNTVYAARRQMKAVDKTLVKPMGPAYSVTRTSTRATKKTSRKRASR